MNAKLATLAVGAMLLAAPAARAFDNAEANTVAAIQASQARALPSTNPLTTFGISLLFGAAAIAASSTNHQ